MAKKVTVKLPVPFPGVLSDEEELERKKKKENDKDSDRGTAFAVSETIEQQKERLLKERELLLQKKEIFDLEHPKLRSTIGKGKRATSRLVTFAGEIAKEGIRATRSRRTKKGRRPSMAVPRSSQSFSTDISLTKAIAMNDWSGGGSIMDRDFFGTDTGERNLLGDRDPEVNIGSGFQRDFFGDKKDLDLIGSTGKVELDLLGNKNSKKKKEIQYI